MDIIITAIMNIGVLITGISNIGFAVFKGDLEDDYKILFIVTGIISFITSLHLMNII